MRIGSYEVVKYRGHQLDGTEIGYLRGTEFSHFLGVFLRNVRSSSFFFVQVGAHNGVSNDHLHDFHRALRTSGHPDRASASSLCGTEPKLQQLCNDNPGKRGHCR